jgi:hypothetical protein
MLSSQPNTKQLTLFGVSQYEHTRSRFGTVVKNDSLTNCTNKDDSFCTDSLTDCNPHERVVSESKCTSGEAALQRTNGVINIYAPGGSSRGENKYYRYSWRENNRVHHKHIPGGHTCCMTAIKRAALVQCEIDLGRSPDVIVEFIKSFCPTKKS